MIFSEPILAWIFRNRIWRNKSAVLPKVKNCQNGTCEPLHEIKKKMDQKHSFETFANRPALLANFLTLPVWEGTRAIQDDKYLKWQ